MAKINNEENEKDNAVTEATENSKADFNTGENQDSKLPTDSEMASEVKRWGAILAKQPKQRIKIKKSDENDKSDVPVAINGYIFRIKKGVYIEVPESVAKILEEADYI